MEYETGKKWDELLELLNLMNDNIVTLNNNFTEALDALASGDEVEEPKQEKPKLGGK
jgi:hypothetical protein